MYPTTLHSKPGHLVAIVLFFSISTSSLTLYGQDSQRQQIDAAITQLLEHYPKATLQDIYKSFYQDRFGPEHLLTDTAIAMQYLRRELETQELFEGPLYEPTGAQGRYVRVNLSAVQRGLIHSETLFSAFYRSTSSAELYTLAQWQAEWDTLVEIASQHKISGFRKDKRRIAAMMKQYDTPQAVSHSTLYKEHYHPHYRIIARPLFEQEIRPYLDR